MYKRLATVAVAAISNGITICDANPPVPTSATIIQSLKTSSYHERELWKLTSSFETFVLVFLDI